ncbi:hypothetical protein JW948_07520 [bacterium]|nr:hypothetical protein [bacterium]
MKRFCLISAVIVLSLIKGVVSGQSVRLQSPQQIDAGCGFQYWKAGDDQVTQIALPMTFVYPRSSKCTLYAKTYPAATNLHVGSDYSLGGLSDIKLGGYYLTLNDELLVTFGMNLPVGRSALKSDEMPVAGVMTIPAFEFDVPSLGQGFDMQLGMNTAWEAGDFIIGYGVSYLFKGPYSPYDGLDLSYNPGDELTITWGVQRQVTWFRRDMHVMADMLYTGYGPDKTDGSRVFSSGDRVILQLLSRFREKGWDVAVYIRQRIKAPNRYGADITLPPDAKNANGNQFQMLTQAYYPYRPDLRIKGIADLKIYASNDYGSGGAFLIGVGGGGEKVISPKMTGTGECRLYFGSLKQSVQGSGVFGLRLMGGIRYEF